ncbi:hypothetical protein BD626DRAFT_507340 [Schizophyllum amplum]|uniref:MYND-type domain-containing protein n=1 Tax=Schizophyllum amplum TaxID=97359 RepID=A0A550C3Y6_9AGAR|nr:hypothetical protein BD626DRAFT_507340 [Auriculariopsis ampla]
MSMCDSLVCYAKSGPPNSITISMSEPITVYLHLTTSAKAAPQMPTTAHPTSGCSTCKNKFYCSSACQKKDWKSHKMNCSPLPAEMTAECRIDEGEASKELPKEQRLALKSQEPSYARCVVPRYNSLRRLYWIDTVANIKTEQDRADLKAALTSMVHTPSYIARLSPKNPGEYRVVEMAVIMSSKSCGCGIHGAGHTTDAVDEAYEKRWLYLATLDNQGRGENSDQPLYYCNLSGVACV